MSSGRVFRFAPTPERRSNHLFVFLHGCGATAQSMIPIAFKFQARFPSAALVVPSGFDPDARGGAAQDWYPTRGLNCDNHRQRGDGLFKRGPHQLEIGEPDEKPPRKLCRDAFKRARPFRVARPVGEENHASLQCSVARRPS